MKRNMRKFSVKDKFLPDNDRKREAAELNGRW